jgi:hypothetical protein
MELHELDGLNMFVMYTYAITLSDKYESHHNLMMYRRHWDKVQRNPNADSRVHLDGIQIQALPIREKFYFLYRK